MKKSYLFLVLSSLIFGACSTNNQDNEMQTQDTSKEKQSEKIKESTKKEEKNDLSLDVADSFETDGSGNVTITGKTEPKAKVQIGFGILNDATEADDSGSFTLKYTLPNAKDKKINILASLGDNTGSKDVTIKPSTEFIASQKTSNNDSNTNTNSNVPQEYKSALNKAKSYSDTMHMSKAGIYDQLTSEYGEKFSAEAAQYAIDNLNADYNANALAKAKSYQEQMSMSPEAIKDQLISEYGEKFTPEEADYAIQHLND